MVNIVDKLNTEIAFLTKYLSFFLIFVTVYSVFSRYFLRNPDIRCFFVSNWLLGISFLLGGAYTLYVGGHVSVDIIFQRLPPYVKKLLTMIDLLVILVFGFVMLLNSISYAWRSTLIDEKDSTMVVFSPPIWWYKWFIAISLVLIILQLFSQISKTLKKR